MKVANKLVKGESPKEKFNFKQWWVDLPTWMFIVGGNAVILAGFYLLHFRGGSEWIAQQVFHHTGWFGKTIDPANATPLHEIYVPDDHRSPCGNVFKGESCHGAKK